jgi:DNA polymerase
MALELDSRQRAMLQEMGVQVWLPETGVAVLERALPASAAAATRSAGAATTTPRATAPPAAEPPAARPPATPVSPAAAATPVPATARSSSTDWPALTQAVQACQACTLCAGRSHATLLPPANDLVPCDWLVLGDPPDEDEDRAGAPFAGQDGVLLANMLRALGLQRANPVPYTPSLANRAAEAATGAATAAVSTLPARRAYVSNALKCRPTHGAVPTAAELERCSAWLQQEIALVQPKIILSLGRFANQMLLGEGPQRAALPLGKLRGTLHRFQGTPMVVSYPPKLLLRTGADKARAWADLCLAAETVLAAREAGGQ